MSSVRGKGLIIRKRVVPKINAKKTEFNSSSENEIQTPLSQESKPPDQKVSTDGNNPVISSSITLIKTDVPPAVTSSSIVETGDSDKSVKINSPEPSENDSISSAAKESVDKLSICDTCEGRDTTNLRQTGIKPPVIANIPSVPISGSKTDKNLAPPLALAKLKKRAAPVVPKKRLAPDFTTQHVEFSNSIKPLMNEDQTDQISSQDNGGQIKENDYLTNSVSDSIVKENTQKDSEELKPQTISEVNHPVDEKLSETKQNPALNPSNDKLLKKRATPVLPKKRPLPNVLSKEIPKDSSKLIDNKNNDKQVKEFPKDSSKLIDNKNNDKQEITKIDQDSSLNLSSAESTSIDLKVQLNSKNITTSHPELTKQETPLACTESLLKKTDETVLQSVPNIEDENLKNDVTSSIKEVQNKVASNKMIKRRLGPKIVNKNASSVIKSVSSKDDVKIADGSNSLDLKPQSPIVQQDNSSTQHDSMHLIESNKNNDELMENEVNSSQSCVENKTKVTIVSKNSQSIADPASPPVVEGVVRIYLNCWPQYPLDDLKEDPFFEDRNIQELGKISIFRSNDKNIAYCDMASNVDFKNIPKNWAYVNFNKLIKEEFKDDEYEEVENPVTEDFSETNDSFNNQYESEKQTYVDQESSPNKLTEDEQLFDESDELNTACNQINQLNEQIKKDDKSLVIEDKTKPEESCNKDVTEPVESVIKKPYKLRKTKPLAIVNYDENEIDDEPLEDIFSNSERSSDSEYDGENKIKAKSEPKKRKRRSKKISNKRTKKPPVKDKEVNTEKKERVKSSKPKKLPENASPFMKLGNQVKNKKKWDDDGNCAEPEKLELKDFIFYVPKSVPMSQEAKEQKTSLTNEETNESKEDKPQEEEEEEENHGPKLIVKDGKIIVDPNSTKIKRTPIMHFKSEKWEKPREINDPWEVRETMKFYANLWKYGIDYSVLAASFPKKSRDALKKKFSYEERYNGSLLGKTLTKKLPLESVLREVVLIDSLEKLNCKRKANNQKVAKESKKEKKQPKHCLLQKRRMKSNKNQEDSKKLRLDNTQFNEIQDDDSRDWSKENDEAISKEPNPIDMNDVITFSTNVFYKDMNIVESVSFHPSAIQPVDINVTISHEPEPIVSPQDTAIK